MKCTICGYENEEGAAFCAGCGNRLKSEEAASTETQNPAPNSTPAPSPTSNPTPNPTPAPTPVYSQPVLNEDNLPDEYKPISMWGYFGYELLFSIPCVGFILLLVFSFGGNKNKNVQNFARSYFCLFIIAFVLAIIILVFAGGSAALVALSENMR